MIKNLSKTGTLVCPNLNTLDCVVDISGFNRATCEKLVLIFTFKFISVTGSRAFTMEIVYEA